MSQKRQQLPGIAKAPATDIQPVGGAADQLFGVEGGIPGFEQDVAQDDALHVEGGERGGDGDGGGGGFRGGGVVDGWVVR